MDSARYGITAANVGQLAPVGANVYLVPETHQAGISLGGRSVGVGWGTGHYGSNYCRRRALPARSVEVALLNENGAVEEILPYLSAEEAREEIAKALLT